MTLAVLALAATVAAAPPPRPFTAGPSVEGLSEYRLPNGLKVLLIPDPSKPTVTVNLTVFVGSRHEGYGEKGMAHLFEHMLFKRTRKFASVKEELTRLGGRANGTTWYDRTNYFETFPANDDTVARAIELEAQRLRSAIISRDELSTEMTVVRNELEMGQNDPNAVLTQRLLSAAFLWHNYGDDTIGPASDLENVPNERLLAWYETYYQPDNAILIIAGKFDEARALAAIARHFAPMPRPRRTLVPTYTVEPVQDGENTVTVRRVGGVPLVYVAYHTPAAADPDFAAVKVATAILGESPSGRLYKALVAPGKAARVDCGALELKDPFVMECDVQLGAKDSTAGVRETLTGTIEQFAAPTRDEVERAKASLLKQYELVLNATDRVGIVLSGWAAMGDWRLFFLGRDRIEAVTEKDVARVAARYFKSSSRTLAEYVPTEKPDRAEISPAPDVAAALKDFTGKPALAQGEAFEATPKNIEARTRRLTLPSGMKVALLPKRTRGETVQVHLQLKLGTEASLKNTTAASEFAARMLLRGTTRRTRQELKDALDALKATVRIAGGGQTVTAVVEARRPQLLEVLDLVGECLTRPAFDAKELEELRRETVASITEAQDEPQAVGSLAAQRVRAPFPKGHPLYVRTFEEQLADAKAVTAAELKAFHQRFYGAGAGLAAVVGDFDEKAVTEKLTGLFGGWKSAEGYTRIPVPFSEVPAADLVTQTPDKANAFFVAITSVKMKDGDADWPALRMANFLLGEGFLSGRVPRRLREKDGLSYGAGTQVTVTPWHDNGSLFGYAIYAPQNVDKVQAGFTEELQKAVATGFTAEELTLAREGFLKGREASRAQDASLAATLAGYLELDRTLDYDRTLEERVTALTVKDVNGAIKKYVDPGKVTYIKVGDFKKVAAPN